MSAPPRRTPVAYYVHVPFCAAHCSYCDYPIAVGGLERAGELVTAVLAEAATLRATLAERAVSALYVGGGTPSFLPLGELHRLLTGLTALVRTHCRGRAGEAVPTECTLEVNPEDLSPALLDVCAGSGVNRLSVGVQSFADGPLQELGRRCTAAQMRAAMELLVGRWRGRLNVDLLVGTPGQGQADVDADVDRCAALGVGHVTLLQMTDPPAGGPRPSAGTDDLWLNAAERLRRRGYADYEISHFGKHGDRSRYVRHALQSRPVAAAGPGSVGTVPAASTVPYGGAADADSGLRTHSGAVRCTHAVELDRYLTGRDGHWGCAAEPVSAWDLLVEHLLQGLRLRDGIAAESALFVPPPGALLGELWQHWQRRGLAHRHSGRLALTARGRLQLDGLMAAASESLQEREDRGEELAAVWPEAPLIDATGYR